MKSLIAFVIALAAAPAAFASGVTCSSADQRVSYTEFRSDGGAFMESTAIALDGETVYQRVNYDAPVVTATFTTGDRVVLETTTVGKTVTTKYVEKLTLTRNGGDGAVLFSDLVLCTAVQAPQCLLCP